MQFCELRLEIVCLSLKLRQNRIQGFQKELQSCSRSGEISHHAPGANLCVCVCEKYPAGWKRIRHADGSEVSLFHGPRRRGGGMWVMGGGGVDGLYWSHVTRGARGTDGFPQRVVRNEGKRKQWTDGSSEVALIFYIFFIIVFFNLKKKKCYHEIQTLAGQRSANQIRLSASCQWPLSRL